MAKIKRRNWVLFGANKISIRKSNLFKTHWIVECRHHGDGLHVPPVRTVVRGNWDDARVVAVLHIQEHNSYAWWRRGVLIHANLGNDYRAGKPLSSGLRPQSVFGAERTARRGW